MKCRSRNAGERDRNKMDVKRGGNRKIRNVKEKAKRMSSQVNTLLESIIKILFEVSAIFSVSDDVGRVQMVHVTLMY